MIRKLTSGWFTLPKVSPLEGFFSRLLFALLLVFTLRNQIDFGSEPHPVGLLKILHKFGDGPFLTWFADIGNWELFKSVFIGLLFFYVAGVGLPVVLPMLAILHVLPFTLNNSQGYTHHGNQIVSCVLIIQAAAVLYYSIREKFTLIPPDERLRAWMLIQAQVIVTGMYFISVFSKMDNSGGMWLWNSSYTALDMIKTQRQSFLNRFDPAYAEIPAEAYWMLEHPWTARLFFGSGLVLEVVCILGIGHRWLGPVMGASLIIMHRCIDQLMGGVAFLYNELLCLVFLINIPFFASWLFERIPHARARWFAVAGLVLGVPLSFWFQPDGVHDFFVGRGGVGPYILGLINELGTWSALEWSEWQKTLHFLSPVFASMAACTVIGGLIGWTLDRGKATPAVAAA